ncbi:MAG: alpha/beta hydrolase [Planctomycetaceae bacterium]|nr:alpha/beta hydrolase [Planctomycetaceae bacterium]
MFAKVIGWTLSALLLMSVTSCRTPILAQPQEEELVEKAPSLDERLLFFPTKFPEGDWEPAQLRFEDVYFTAEDGTKLHGWYCPAETPKAVLLVAHGNAGHVASRAPWLKYLQERAKVTVFMFDYRGYGRSEGRPTVDGAIQDAVAARAKLCELAKVKDSEILLMGESLGGAIVVQLVAKSAPRGLILQSTFSSLRDIAECHFPALAWVVPPEKLNSATAISNYKGELLISHGTMDATIPFALGEKIFQNANEPKEFVSIENVGHNDWMTESYLKKLDEFIDRVGKSSK